MKTQDVHTVSSQPLRHRNLGEVMNGIMAAISRRLREGAAECFSADAIKSSGLDIN